jgi:HlyD family secretion protein
MGLTGRRVLIWGVLSALLAAGLAFAFWPQPVPVDLGEVARGPLRVTVDEEGRTRVKDVYVVSAPLAGRMFRIEGKVGDAVRAGETVLATIEPTQPTFLDVRSRTEAESAVKTAEAAKTLADAELARARAELDFARADYQRAKTLAARDTISQRALDRAELELKTRQAALATALAAVRVKTFELETARAALITPDGERTPGAADPPCCVDVRAPVSGRILRVFRESEGVVAAAEPLIEIGDPGALEIEVDLLSTDAVKVEEGAEVIVEDWGGAFTLQGRVRRVEPYGFTKISALGIEEQRVNVIIDFTDPPEKWQRLGHGYRVETRIVVWEGADVLKVPLSALFRDGDAWAVFVAAQGRARLRHVSIGESNSREAQVLDDLAEGERVVLHPSDRVEDGGRIIARGSS